MNVISKAKKSPPEESREKGTKENNADLLRIPQETWDLTIFNAGHFCKQAFQRSL